ncbi:hypothetical protein KFL_002680130 [Klebsormidium nitens]|uniref:Uncharacterized protein n=1 Tax=Klebsormidium nitens TaxID=105231 RepID=A0A1Y1IBG4_KLENI|nr:hypothetical protein KFL_002680130 [Klebsormidium nitens]|eukprot:GAQ86067.1 hypothetical protein KFL_002680130 [Klebsormidium nitens]
MNAALETDSENEGLSQVLAKLKRRAPDGATKPLQNRRRRRVVYSSPDFSDEDDSPSSGRRHVASAGHLPVPVKGDVPVMECPMPDDLPPLPEDDDWSDDLPPEPEEVDWLDDGSDWRLEDAFDKSCAIVPQPRGANNRGASSMTSAAIPQNGFAKLVAHFKCFLGPPEPTPADAGDPSRVNPNRGRRSSLSLAGRGVTDVQHEALFEREGRREESGRRPHAQLAKG